MREFDNLFNKKSVDVKPGRSRKVASLWTKKSLKIFEVDNENQEKTETERRN